MKIYIALFTTLIAAGHFTNVSAADVTASVDGASHPHLRALADTAVDVACPNGYCTNDKQCDQGSECVVGGSGGCSGKCAAVITVSGCPIEGWCDANGHGCPDGASCDTGYPESTDGCYGCLRPDGVGFPEPKPQPLGLKLAASTTVDMIEEVEEEEEVDAIQHHEDDMEASSLRASILKQE
mmetsp:Transcript_25513/g.39226  ORF Transcript_25513/g.39226 Transcript_25513/m.39226 type:complete len:182 (-) Transcript_25513:402-947(-)